MTLAAIGGYLCYPDTICDFNTSSVFTFDAANDMAVWITQIPASGDIANVHWNVNASSTPVLTITISVQTVDTTTGKATGTNYKAHTSATLANPTTGNKSSAVNITSAVKGDLVAVVLKATAWTSGNIAINYRSANIVPTNFPYRTSDTGTGDTLAANAFSHFSLEYTGGVFYPMLVGACCGVASSVNVSTTNPTSRGNIFRPPFPCRAVGIWAEADIDSCTFTLRDSSGTALTGAVVTGSGALFTGVRGSNSRGLNYYLFDAGATASLTAGTDYIVTIDGVDATISSIAMWTAPAVAHFGQISGGGNCYGYTYSGSWLAANTTRYAIGVILDQIDNGAGTGGGVPMSRIFTGM